MEYMPVSYDLTLVVGSVLIALAASYTTLELINRVTNEKAGFGLVWYAAGAFSMGCGIWSMHFVGMLAFSMPMPYEYDVGITILSLFISILSSFFAILISTRNYTSGYTLLLGGCLLGFGIFGMHYVGMLAMKMEAKVVYNPALLITSFMIALVAATAALWFAQELRYLHQRHKVSYKIGATIIMSMAIAGMHYIGMAAVDYIPFDEAMLGNKALNAIEAGDNRWLAVTVGVMTVFILGLTNLTLFFDNKLSAQLQDDELLSTKSKECAGDLITQNNELNQVTGLIDVKENELISLQQQNDKLKVILNHVTNKVCVFSERSLLLNQFNQRVLDELGFSENELLSFTPVDIFPQYDQQGIDALLNLLREGEEKQLFIDTMVRLKSGNAVPAKVRVYTYGEDNSQEFMFFIDTLV